MPLPKAARSRSSRRQWTPREFESEWSRPILFYPDGTTSDAFVVVANENERGIQVNLRGMTGTATLSDIIDLKGE